MLKDIFRFHIDFLRENEERLTSEKCKNMMTPITYVVEGLCVPKSIETFSIKEKTFDSDSSKIFHSMVLNSSKGSTENLKESYKILDDRFNSIILGDLSHHKKLAAECKIVKTFQPRKLFNPHFMSKVQPK